MTNTNCATGTISPYVPSDAKPWNRERALHLYRRMGFGANATEIAAALQKDTITLVDEIIDAAIALPPAEEPEWAYWAFSDYTDINQAIEQVRQWTFTWIKDMIKNGFREKVALFWHNHFVTQIEAYNCPSYQYQYHKLLQQHALGDFTTFVKDIGKTPAMLVYLNGVQNTKFEPNENYARELYELFALGRDNGYTQQDISETAKALTGWNGFTEGCAAIGYVSNFHDNSQKTIFGNQEAFDYNGVHTNLFENRAEEIATYICTKIYRHFVNVNVDNSIVAELANTFLDKDTPGQPNKFQLAPVFRRLFKSEHFFDEANINVQIKDPIQFFIGFIKEADLFYNDEIIEGIEYFSTTLGQQLFNPIDVAGWEGDRDWIKNTTMTGRWQFLDFYIFTLFQSYPDELVNLAKRLTNNSNDPYFITQVLVDHFIPSGLQTPEEYDRAATIFKWEVPENYYENSEWNLDWDFVHAQVGLLLQHIGRQPEFQLM